MLRPWALPIICPAAQRTWCGTHLVEALHVFSDPSLAVVVIVVQAVFNIGHGAPPSPGCAARGGFRSFGAAVLHSLALCASWGPGGAALPQLSQMQSEWSNSKGRRGHAGTRAESERTAPDCARSGLRAAAAPARSRVPAAPASSVFLQSCLPAGLRGANF